VRAGRNHAPVPGGGGDFGFRRKAQVRTNYHFNFMQLIFSTSKTQDRNNINTRYNIIYLIL